MVKHTYDAFVLYSSEDRDRRWVHKTFVPVMERMYGYKLCIEHQDFLGGIDMADNIEHAIRSSNKVIVIMSPSFINCHWCKTGVEITESVDFRKLVVISYRPIPVVKMHIPYAIRKLLQDRRRIRWNAKTKHKLFWRRVDKALKHIHRP